jgi:hypothetical protein
LGHRFTGYTNKVEIKEVEIKKTWVTEEIIKLFDDRKKAEKGNGKEQIAF